MRDFDQERHERHTEREKALGDRSFILGGETFTHRSSVSVDLLERLTSDVPLAGGAYIDAIKESCLEIIEDDCACFDGEVEHNGPNHLRFIALLKRKRDPITLQDLQATFQGLVEEAFRRPTQASLPSGDGDAETGPGSTENPSTEPASAAAA